MNMNNSDETKRHDSQANQTEESCHTDHESCAKNCKEQITALLEQVSAAKDRYARLFADVENMKRRESEEQRLKIELMQKKIFLDLLPIIDNFERAIQVELSHKETSPSGIKLIYALFIKFLEQQGIVVIDTSGEFNPEMHEAISQVIDATKQPGTIVQVFEKGYYLHKTVLRHAKVAVVA
jgi:molecular chaperone GrpE